MQYLFMIYQARERKRRATTTAPGRSREYERFNQEYGAAFRGGAELRPRPRRRPSAYAAARCCSQTDRSRRPRNSSPATTWSRASRSTTRSSSPRRPRRVATARSRSARRWRGSDHPRLRCPRGGVRVFREESGRTVAILIRILGDIDLAEDAVQDAYVARSTTGRARASERPCRLDLPDRPQPRRGRDPSARRHAEKLRRLEQEGDHAMDAEDGGTRRGVVVTDDRLRLMFTVCHPALQPEAQVALTLRLLGGLTTAEVAGRSSCPRRPSPSASCARSARSARRDPLPHAARPSAARTARSGAGDPVPDLQRGLHGDRRGHALAP